MLLEVKILTPLYTVLFFKKIKILLHKQLKSYNLSCRHLIQITATKNKWKPRQKLAPKGAIFVFSRNYFNYFINYDEDQQI